MGRILITLLFDGTVIEAKQRLTALKASTAVNGITKISAQYFEEVKE